MRYLNSLLLLSLAGCTSIETVRTQDVASVSENVALMGVSYGLPALQYTVKMKRILSECKDDVTPSFAIKPEVTSAYVSGERYEVDPSKLSNILKTSSVGLTFYEDLDTLKGFNAAADDKTADVIVDVARIGIAAASIAASGGTVAAGVMLMGESPTLTGVTEAERAVIAAIRKGDVPRYEVHLACTPAGRERLKDLKTKTGELEKLEAKLTELNDEIAQEKALSGFRNFSSSEVSRLVELVKQSIALSRQVAAKKKEAVDAQAFLMVEGSDTWPEVAWKQPGLATQEVFEFSGSAQKHKKFCENFTIAVVPLTLTSQRMEQLGVIISPQPDCQTLLKYFAEQSRIRLSLEPETKRTFAPQRGAHDRFTIDPGKPSKGIFVREPERARLLVEQPDADAAKGWKTIFTDETRWVPQIGRLRYLPFESGPFENEAMTLALRKDGRVESIAYETKDAALARLAKAGADGAEKIAKAREDAETEYRSDIDRTRADAQYARDEAKKNADSLAAQRQAEIAELDYRIAKEQKTKTLLKEQTPTDPDLVAQANELAQINAELALLRAEKERLQLAKDIAELRKLHAGAGT